MVGGGKCTKIGRSHPRIRVYDIYIYGFWLLSPCETVRLFLGSVLKLWTSFSITIGYGQSMLIQFMREFIMFLVEWGWVSRWGNLKYHVCWFSRGPLLRTVSGLCPHVCGNYACLAHSKRQFVVFMSNQRLDMLLHCANMI